MKQKIKHHKLILMSLSMTLLAITVFSGCSHNLPDSPANATEKTPNLEETSSDIVEETTSLPEGTAYLMDDGTVIYTEDLMTPINMYNTICTTGNAEGFSSVYPECVINFISATTECNNISEYASYLYGLYCKVYNENFSMSNDFVSCELLSESELEAFCSFYLENFNEEIVPEYGFIVESTYEIFYEDEEGNEQSDSDTDFFIAYFYNGSMYLDYFYIDTIDL